MDPARALELRSTPVKGDPHRHEAPTAQAPPRCLTHEAGISPHHAEGDGLTGLTSKGRLTGVTSDGEPYAFIPRLPHLPAGTPLTRARIPCAMPEASV